MRCYKQCAFWHYFIWNVTWWTYDTARVRQCCWALLYCSKGDIKQLRDIRNIKCSGEDDILALHMIFSPRNSMKSCFMFHVWSWGLFFLMTLQKSWPFSCFNWTFSQNKKTFSKYIIVKNRNYELISFQLFKYFMYLEIVHILKLPLEN